MQLTQIEEQDPKPEWWKIYGISLLCFYPFSLRLLQLPGFTEPWAHQSGILYKRILDISNITNYHMLAALRASGSFHWFITRKHFFRRFGGNMNGSSHDYDSFHAMKDPYLNPFGPLLFQDEVPEYVEVPI